MERTDYGKKDERPPKGGWAPGHYQKKCIHCNELFIGDKLALSCAGCAYRTEEEGSELKTINRFDDEKVFSRLDMLRWARYLKDTPGIPMEAAFRSWHDGPTPGEDRPRTIWVKREVEG